MKFMQIYLLVTDNCNLQCKMCIRGKQVGTEIDYEELKTAEWLYGLKDHDIVITGGEPTLHNQFDKIIKLMTSHAKTVTITTNGTINSYIKSELLRDNLFFQISIDGEQSMHDEIRGEGSFENSMKTVELLDSIGSKYCVASVVNKNNISSVKLLEKRLRKLRKLNYWRISFEMPFGSAGFNDMLSAEEWNDFVDDILDLAQLRVVIKKIFPFKLYDRKKEKLEAIYGEKSRCDNCGSGNSEIYVYPDWTVYACTCLTDFPLGNLKEQSFNEILEGEKIQRFKNYDCTNPICKDCQYFRYCNGGCIGMSYHYYGELGMGDIRCPILKANEQ